METTASAVCPTGIDYGFDPVAPRTLNELVALRARADSDRTYITFLADADQDAHRLTFAELERDSLQVAGALAARGLQPGERVLLILPTGLGFVRAFFGILAAGMIPVPAYPPARLARLEHYLRTLAGIVEAAGCGAGVVDGRLIPLIAGRLPGGMRLLDEGDLTGSPAAAAHALEPASAAFLQFTSGTTARPRGVLLYQQHVMAQLASFAETTRQAPGKVGVSWLPLYHDLGLIGKLCACLYAGMELILLSPVDFLKDPICWLRAISRHGGTHTAAPNFAYDLCVRKCPPERLAEEQIDLSTLEISGMGGEPVSWETVERFRAHFEPVGLRAGGVLCPCYGLAENTLGATGHRHGEDTRSLTISRDAFEQGAVAEPSTPEDAWTLPSNGRAMPAMTLRIAGPAGQALEEREIGEIWISSPSVAAGYFDDGEATRVTFVETGDGRWLRTGDLGFLDRGDLYICGRQKDMLIVRGRNYHPQDIEGVAGGVPGVRTGNVAAFAVADEGQPERCVVVCELDERAGRSREEVRASLAEAVCAAFDLNVEVCFVPRGSVPKTSSGKLQRSLLKQAYQEGQLGSFAPPGALRKLKLWSTLKLNGLRRRKAAGVPAGERTAAPAADSVATLDPRIVEAMSRAFPGHPALSPRLRLDAIGLDSLARMELWLAVESLYRARVPQEAWGGSQTLADVQRLAERYAGTRPAGEREEDTGVPLFVRQLLEGAATEELPPPHRPPRGASLAFGIVNLASRLVWRMRVAGLDRLPADGSYILAGNHLSYLDGAWLRRALPAADRGRLTAISFAELDERSRAIAWFSSLVETIPIDPAKSFIGAMQGGLQALTQDRILLIFPEGQRSFTGRLEAFRPGVGLLSLLSGRPILPFKLSGAFEIYPRHRALPRFVGWRDGGTRRLEVRFGEPIAPPEHDPGRTWRQASEQTARVRRAVVQL